MKHVIALSKKNPGLAGIVLVDDSIDWLSLLGASDYISFLRDQFGGYKKDCGCS